MFSPINLNVAPKDHKKKKKQHERVEGKTILITACRAGEWCQGRVPRVELTNRKMTSPLTASASILMVSLLCNSPLIPAHVRNMAGVVRLQ